MKVITCQFSEFDLNDPELLSLLEIFDSYSLLDTDV